ncbi:stage II sporulation protein P [Aneurinibacillus soli]|uniref:Stage II sporulation protein P SpoIIP n=1 Tax=Aneurinibacillus soli TaxID=1500254 RepID=A0A0U5BG58_9BACL|nr:stage II sporulation protein P [Aneurinibacillus soli]PYE62604.1 stage II sporulation protein P [Aneurinibacillus soli]BAU27166.1 Stage II sporulation protein P SpoIIP [Aneurinibacillus soli]
MQRKYRGVVLNLNGAGVQRSFIMLSLSTAVVFILLGMLFVSHAGRGLSSQHVGKIAVGMSNGWMLQTLRYELPYFQPDAPEMETVNIPTLMFRLVTSINPDDPRTLLGYELPGFSLFDTEVLVSEKAVALSDLPFESSPPPEALRDEPAVDKKEAPVPPQDTMLSTKGKKVMFIYNTHNRESWVSEVPKAREKNDPNLAMDSKTNVTLVSKRMAKTLEQNGIGSTVGLRDFTGILNQRSASYSLSYAESLKMVKSVVAQDRNLNYFIDIHRDSLPRKSTTATINGKTYAQTFFVIGMRNPNWEKNQQFALKVHNVIEKKYPGLSKGIFGKKGGNGEYNQSVSPNSILIEVGGPDNTVEECYRTADILAEAIAEVYWEAEKANAKPKAKRS